MMPESSYRILLGQRLHGLTLSLAALNEAPFFLIKVDQVCDAHFLALRLDLGGGICAGRGPSKYFLRLFSRLIGSQNTITPNSDASFWRASPTSFCTIFGEEGLNAGWFDA